MSALDERTVLVTGGSAGIGHAIAEAFHAGGAKVALTSRSLDRAQIAAEEIGEGVLGVACDVRDPEACDAAVAATVRRFGGVDVLVNNAGLGVFRSIKEMTREEWERQIRTNLDGVFYMTKAALPALIEAEDAWILNIGSLASRNTFAGGVGYNASKFGLLGMTEAMMLDLRYDGIRAAIVMPGSVNTDFSHVGEDRQWAIQPEDVAEAVLHVMAQPQRTLVSRVEIRPTAPPRK